MSLVLDTTPGEYGYVLLVATSTFFVNLVHGGVTARARNAARVLYPAPYASNEQADKEPKAYAFNCAQRAHAQFTENQTSFLGALLISGLRYPVASAVLGAGWTVSRLVYLFGYSKIGPQGRMVGVLGHYLFLLSLKFMALYTSTAMIMDW